MEPEQWFFCLKHHTVEPRDGCAERHRLGPYATREQAEETGRGIGMPSFVVTAQDSPSQ